MSNRVKAPGLCKCLQALTQNGIISAAKAGECVKAYMNDDVSILVEIVNSKDTPVAMLPLMQPLRQFIQ